MNPAVFRTRLPNGLPVVTIEAPHLHAALCAVYVRVGSRHENAQTNGVSHMLEHLFFRGSARFKDSVKMNAAVEAVGGNLNAVTMRDSSYYYTPIHPKGVGVALEILGDMLSRPRLAQLPTEKRIILEEMLDEVDERGRDIDVENLTKRALHGKHPLALKIAGTPESVQGLTEAVVRRHFAQHYVAQNMVLAVAGPVRHGQIVRLAKRHFSALPSGAPAKEEPARVPPREGPYTQFVTLDEAQVEFRIAFPAVPERHPDAMALSHLRRVLDDGLSSRLPYNIVERRGLAYSIGATLELLHDTGTFDVDGACAPENFGQVVAEVLRTLASLKRGEITQAELTRAKRRYRMHLDFLLDSPGDLCGWFGGAALFFEPESFKKKLKESEAVRLKDLVRVANTYLTADTLHAVAVGPRAAKRKLERTLKRARTLLNGARRAGAA